MEPKEQALMRVLVVGRSGQLAQALSERCARSGQVAVLFVGRPQIDLADPTSLREALDPLTFDLVINAAAYTAVDHAESEPALAMLVNSASAGMLAGIAADRGVPIIHLSTDFVFSGDAGPYDESASARPSSVYGATKLEGERRVAEANPSHLILRTAWVHGPFGHNFARTMLALAVKGQDIRVVDDQRGNPTNVLNLADAIVELATALHAGAGAFGTYHLVGGESATWAQFATAIMVASKELGGPSVNIKPICSADYRTAALRPGDSRLDCGKALRTFGVALPSFRAGLSASVSRLLANS